MTQRANARMQPASESEYARVLRAMIAPFSSQVEVVRYGSETQTRRVRELPEARFCFAKTGECDGKFL